MHVIVLKYVQVLCITIFFSNNINCDKLLLHNEQEDQELYRIGACTAACMAGTEPGEVERNGTKALPSAEELKTIGYCYKLCSEDTRPLSAWPALVQRREPSLRINLICRDSTNLIIEIKPTIESEETQSSKPATMSSPPGGNQNQLSALQDDALAGGREAFNESVPSRTRRAIGSDGPEPRQKANVPRSNLLLQGAATVDERFAKTDGAADAIAVKVQPERAKHLAGNRPVPIYLVKVQEAEQELGDRIVYMCPYTKLQRIPGEKWHTTVKIDAARRIGLRLLERDAGKYSYDNDTALCQFNNAQLGEFGVYDLHIRPDGCTLETAKEPVNIYLPFLTIALIVFAAFGLVRLARYGLSRSRLVGFQQPSTQSAGTGTGDAPQSSDETDKPQTAATTTAQVTPKKRLQSLDTFRGIAIMLMIFVNSGGGHYWWIEHATWNGLHVADLVFPWFLFIMGVCVPISLRGQLNRNIPRRTILSNIAVSNASLLKIENLAPNKRYNVTATMLTSNYEYYYVEKHQFSTLHPDYMPGVITNIMVERFEPNVRDSRLVDAVISWNPAIDKTCHYEIVCHASFSPDFLLKPIDVQQPEVLYKYTIKALKLNANYMIAVRSKNMLNAMRESKLHWQSFHTPTCTNLTNGTLVCAPEPITNVHVEQVPLSSGNHYQLNISWDRPTIAPDSYVVNVFDLHHPETEDPANSLTKNLTGDAVGLLIDSFEMFGPHFEVLVSAYSRVGVSSERIIKTLQIGRVSSESWIRTKLVFIILTPVLMIGLLKISISLICRRRAKLKRYEERCEYFKELEQKAPVDPSTEFEPTSKQMQDLLASSHPFSPDLIAPINDELEIEMEHIKLQDMLGEGAFGLVRKGLLQRDRDDDETSKPVAVKMLKECPRVEDIIEFRREMEVMKSVGTHPHIVGIVGHCTKNVRKMMLLTEYCGRGNLLNYLRLQWQRLLRQNRATLSFVGHTAATPTSMVPDSLDGCVTGAAEHECLTPALDNNKMPENVFNFDTSFVNDKKSLTYKNISDQRQTLLAYGGGSDGGGGARRSPQIIENKLYPLFNEEGGDVADEKVKLTRDTYCTETCKSVEKDPKQSEEELLQSGARIEPCSCHGLMLDSTLTNNTVENRCYQSCSPSSEDEDPHPNSGQLLEFSRQIALGMEFLARNKVVHRDLAARNVLVCDNNTVKIADFGLSRDIYQENLYRKTSNGKLPIKWLALESMTHQVYTSQSDVWSYGILLYEICTLGGSPYPSISTGKLLRYLESGYRMERPKSCSEPLYDLMYSCWNVHPGERPTFSKVVHTVEQLQERDTANDPVIIDLNAIVDSHCIKNTTEENSYLKPVEY